MKIGSTYVITWDQTDGDVEVSVSVDGIDGSYTLIDTVTTSFDEENPNQQFTLSWVVDQSASKNCFFKFKETSSGYIFYSDQFTIYEFANSGNKIKNKLKVKMGFI